MDAGAVSGPMGRALAVLRDGESGLLLYLGSHFPHSSMSGMTVHSSGRIEAMWLFIEHGAGVPWRWWGHSGLPGTKACRDLRLR